jgi:tetratricopeptide (TPR) repeat protein
LGLETPQAIEIFYSYAHEDEPLCRELVQAGQTAALSQPQAISGLGGIGKTQIAVEYAYRYRQDYQYVLWTRADTHEALVSGYVVIAELLNLPEKEARDQIIAIQAVIKWLTTHTQWLLTLDNADDLSIIHSFLPSTSSGHILLTTRTQAMGKLAHRIEIDVMDRDVGAELLLRRAGLIAQNTSLESASLSDVATACEISETLGGLPLALDQAGAYIEESQCSLLDYQSLYRSQRTELLNRRGSFIDDHPESVAATWSLSFQAVERKSSMAAALLRCCVFLHPDAIPESLVTAGATHLGPQLRRLAHDPLALNNAITVLRAYSLIRRDPTTATLSIHRLVQAVLRDTMPKKTVKQWKDRIVRAVNTAFPEATFEVWVQCEQLLPHVLVCATWMEDEPIAVPEAARLFNEAGVYLRDRARYAEAEILLTYSLTIREQQLGIEHPFTAISLNSLANLYRRQGKIEKAEPFYKRALTIREKWLGMNHPDTARTLNNLGNLYRDTGRYEAAEPLYMRSLTINEQRLGSEHPDTAHTLNNLAFLYYLQGKYEEAEPLYKRALAIREQELGSEHPRTAQTLTMLADIYSSQSEYKQAEQLYQRALTIREQHLGPEHPDTAHTLNGLANLYNNQGKYEQAERLYQRALTINEQTLGLEHPDTQVIRDKYITLLYLMRRDTEAMEIQTKHKLS